MQKVKIAVASVFVASAIITQQATAAVVIDSLNTTLTDGPDTTVNDVPGGGIGTFPGGEYDVTWQGKIQAIDQLNTASGSFVPGPAANKLGVRRALGQTGNLNWFRGNASPSNSNITLDAPTLAQFEDAFTSNNILVGIDNLFSNVGDTNGNNSNVERLDYIFTGGFKASKDAIFAIFDRGTVTAHDPFKIAAITSLDPSNNPASYGVVSTFALGKWGEKALVPTSKYVIMRDEVGDGEGYLPSDVVTQTIGGVAVPTSELVAAGTTIFGYSLFAADTKGAGNQLIDWTNTAYFPSNTNGTNLKALGGGLDPLGASSILFVLPPGSSIPEPTGGLLMLAATGMTMMRPRKRAA